jgi:hypothetical protein
MDKQIIILIIVGVLSLTFFGIAIGLTIHKNNKDKNKTQPGTPSTQPASTQPGTPSTQPASTQPGTPSTQPGTPSTQPGTPSTQPGTPSTQPGTPSTQPGTPSTQPGTPSTQPGPSESCPDPKYFYSYPTHCMQFDPSKDKADKFYSDTGCTKQCR